MANHLLSVIPDLQIAAQVEAWAAQACAGLTQGRDFDEFISVTVADLDPLDKAAWQKFVNAALLADWACYGAAADRVDYPRLRDVMSAFPQGFRVWFSRCAGQDYVPVAYTGWYPIAAALFDKLCAAPETITHRGNIVPQVPENNENFPLWLFNYSIIAPLRNTNEPMKRRMNGSLKRHPRAGGDPSPALSANANISKHYHWRPLQEMDPRLRGDDSCVGGRCVTSQDRWYKSKHSAAMLRAYAADIAAARPSGLAAAVISEDSKRVTRRFAMRPVGLMTHMGVSEEVWATRLNLVPREGED